MWNKKTFLKFVHSLKKLDALHRLLAASCLLLAILYPGHNYFQSLIIHPGPLISYLLPAPSFLPYPQSDGTQVPPTSARAIVVQDAVSKSMIFSRAADTTLLPASTTKIMTALVALDTWDNLDTIITVHNEDHAIGSTMNLVKGEQITIKNLLYGLLIPSGNDAALALADNFPGGYSAFIDSMNTHAKSLHLDHTTYKNPSGVEQYGHVTTARDLAVLAAVALQNSTLAQIVQTPSIVVTDTTGTITHSLKSTDELLGEIEGFKGLKTGWTTNAGECLVSYVERGDHKVIIVVLGSRDRFGDTRTLVDWTYNHHAWVTPQI
jgi:D-alanyl-D-alanine carboxypeptidase (penicillin-binding protein 5/6)